MDPVLPGGHVHAPDIDTPAQVNLGDPEVDNPQSGGDRWSINLVFGSVCAFLGLVVGLSPLSDNSFMTHLATGRIILDTRAVPTGDPYSFMAPGEAWVVQSWFASLIYGVAEKVGGLYGIRVIVALITAVLASLVWRLSRPANFLLSRVAVAGLGLVVAIPWWNERPLIIGMLCLALLLVAVEGGLDPRWLVPIMWLWVNTHGSFVFGGLLLVLAVLGRLLDREALGPEWGASCWAAGGVALAVVNPLGLRLLLFPLGLLERREAFRTVVEWQAPGWDTWNQRLFALQVLVTLVALMLRHLHWRRILPVLVFAAAAAVSVRNIPQASLVMVPALGAAMIQVGSVDGRRRSPVVRPIVGVIACLGLVVLVSARAGPQVDETVYPVDAVSWLEEEGLIEPDARVVSRDYGGNYLHARYGPDRLKTYIDDRVDMHPFALMEDYDALLNDPDADYAAILDRASPTAVVWTVGSNLSEWLETAPSWLVVFEDEDWIVALPNAE